MPVPGVSYLNVPARNSKTQRLIRQIKAVDYLSRRLPARDNGRAGGPVREDFPKSRLQLPPLVLDVVEIDGDEADLLERRLPGRRRHVDARRMDAAVDDDPLGFRRDHELRERLSGVRVPGALEHCRRRRHDEYAL